MTIAGRPGELTATQYPRCIFNEPRLGYRMGKAETPEETEPK